MRMTIDTNLRVLPMPDRAFIPGVGFPLIEGQCIVELKYRVEVPALFKQLVETFELTPSPVSKYRIGLGALDYAPLTADTGETPCWLDSFRRWFWRLCWPPCSRAARRPPGPQAQKPAAAEAEKPAKPPKPWPPDEETLQKRKAEAEALPLFASQEPIEITLTADWKAVQRDRNDDSKKLYPGTLPIVKDGSAGTPVPIQLRTRGHSRRNPRTASSRRCASNSRRTATKGTVFEGHGNLKLGTHCQSEGIYLQYTLKEYLANRLHNLLTPRSLRVRLASVTYADSQPGKKARHAARHLLRGRRRPGEADARRASCRCPGRCSGTSTRTS